MDVVELDRRAAMGTAALIAATSISQYDAPTPCPDWTVVDLLTHLVAGNVKYTDIGLGEEWARGVPDVVLGDDPAETYRRTHDAMLDAWRRPGALDRDTALPVGRGRAELALHLHLGETLVHGWDLARSIGAPPAYDDDVVEASLAYYTSWLPPMRPPGAPFAGARPEPPGATSIDRLAAYLGRDDETWSS